ncbi:hypothetical protein [Indioceanicola profundi]|uniref:hypothetical protein n=1 Tax=Indioceanicola profundi TaxID=2220096 RepID=UPI000E6AD1D1|nr:hypothetical protein [Indioceanicola profundi]
MMDGLPFWFGIVASIAAAAHIADLVSKRIRHAKALYAARHRQLQEITHQMRDKAKITLALRREEQAMAAELESLSRSIHTGEDAVVQQKSQESLLYVLEENRNAGDQAFLARITHRAFARVAPAAPQRVLDSWSQGRQFLVWGAMAQAAQAKAAMRYPHGRGFTVGAADAYKGNADEL